MAIEGGVDARNTLIFGYSVSDIRPYGGQHGNRTNCRDRLCLRGDPDLAYLYRESAIIGGKKIGIGPIKFKLGGKAQKEANARGTRCPPAPKIDNPPLTRSALRIQVRRSRSRNGHAVPNTKSRPEDVPITSQQRATQWRNFLTHPHRRHRRERHYSMEP